MEHENVYYKCTELILRKKESLVFFMFSIVYGLFYVVLDYSLKQYISELSTQLKWKSNGDFLQSSRLNSLVEHFSPIYLTVSY